MSLKELALLELEFLWRVEWRIVPKPEVLVDYYRSLVERSEGFRIDDPHGLLASARGSGSGSGSGGTGSGSSGGGSAASTASVTSAGKKASSVGTGDRMDIVRKARVSVERT